MAGRTAIPFDEMVKMDYLYVAEWSLWNHIRLLLRTVPVVAFGRSESLPVRTAAVSGGPYAATAVRVRQGPRGSIRGGRPMLRLTADDPQAREFLCTLDGEPIRCGRVTRLPRREPGRHVLEVRAGGPGMLAQERPRVLRYRVR